MSQDAEETDQRMQRKLYVLLAGTAVKTSHPNQIDSLVLSKIPHFEEYERKQDVRQKKEKCAAKKEHRITGHYDSVTAEKNKCVSQEGLHGCDI